MSVGGSRALAQHAEQRSSDASERVENALRELNSEGARISFSSVARRAGVSRGFLYRGGYRDEIERLRQLTTGASSVPATERARETALKVRLRNALDENGRLRAEIQTLREELAITHGAVRELELDRRTGRR